MSEAAPLISIVTPSLNQGAFIPETIRSVMGQNYPRVEHIVVDGGSTDSTLAILATFPHLKWTSEPDTGQSNAVNKGMKRATGEILGWINSDDTFLPGAFDAVAARFAADPTCNVVFGDYVAIDEKGAILYRKTGFCSPHNEMVRWWKYTYAIHQPTLFVRRRVLDDVGYLDESYHYAMDYEWWLRLSAKHPFHHVNKTIATYRLHAAAKTSTALEDHVYPEQLRASKAYWGSPVTPGYWVNRFSYRRFLKHKPQFTYHDTILNPESGPIDRHL